jgi:hypothetical protein
MVCLHEGVLTGNNVEPTTLRNPQARTYTVFPPDTAFSSDIDFERNNSSRLLAFWESMLRLETSKALRNSDLAL